MMKMTRAIDVKPKSKFDPLDVMFFAIIIGVVATVVFIVGEKVGYERGRAMRAANPIVHRDVFHTEGSGWLVGTGSSGDPLSVTAGTGLTVGNASGLSGATTATDFRPTGMFTGTLSVTPPKPTHEDHR